VEIDEKDEAREILGNEEIDPEKDPKVLPLQCMERGDDIADKGSGVNKGEFKLKDDDMKEFEVGSVLVSPVGEVGESGRWEPDWLPMEADFCREPKTGMLMGEDREGELEYKSIEEERDGVFGVVGTFLEVATRVAAELWRFDGAGGSSKSGTVEEIEFSRWWRMGGRRGVTAGLAKETAGDEGVEDKLKDADDDARGETKEVVGIVAIASDDEVISGRTGGKSIVGAWVGNLGVSIEADLIGNGNGGVDDFVGGRVFEIADSLGVVVVLTFVWTLFSFNVGVVFRLLLDVKLPITEIGSEYCAFDGKAFSTRGRVDGVSFACESFLVVIEGDAAVVNGGSESGISGAISTVEGFVIRVESGVGFEQLFDDTRGRRFFLLDFVGVDGPRDNSILLVSAASNFNKVKSTSGTGVAINWSRNGNTPVCLYCHHW
jgi:hypothetical protein